MKRYINISYTIAVGMGVIFMVAAGIFLSGTVRAQVSCTNNLVPSGFALPCPVFSLSQQSGTLNITSTPLAGTSYIYQKIYISEPTQACTGKAGAWCPFLLPSPYVYTQWKNTESTLSLSLAQMNLSAGTHYAVLWDWTWDANAQCYKGPGLNQCNTGNWRVQSFEMGGPSATSLPGSDPLIFLDLIISGKGSQSTVSVSAIPLTGFYSPPSLDSSEYHAKLLDSGGQTIFIHSFNAPNIVVGEALDTANQIDPLQSIGGTLTTVRDAILIPAISGSKTLQITDATGVELTRQAVAGVVDESHRQFARLQGYSAFSRYLARTVPDLMRLGEKYLAPTKAHAANGSLRVAVLGVNYPSQAEFDTDWQAFKNLLLTSEPYKTYASTISIEPVGIFGRTDSGLNCGAYAWPNGCAPAVTCDRGAVKKLANARGAYDTYVTFYRSTLSTGCAWFDDSISAYEWTRNEFDLGVGGSAFVTTQAGNPNMAAWLGVHEFSHAFGSLLDEYDSKLTGYYAGRNCDVNSACSLWNNATYGINACIAGCAGNKTTLWRSSPDSIMRSTGNLQYNALGKILLQKRFTKLGIGQTSVQDTQSPTVSIADPGDGDIIKDTYTLWAVAEDNVGVIKVEFYANDQLLGLGVRGTDSKTFRLFWDTRIIPDGVYRISVKAFDVAGNIGQSQNISAIISNGSVPQQVLRIDKTQYPRNGAYTISITNAPPNSPVKFRAWHSGISSWDMGCGIIQYATYGEATWCPWVGAPAMTDGSGNWSYSGVWNSDFPFPPGYILTTPEDFQNWMAKGFWTVQAEVGVITSNIIKYWIPVETWNGGPGGGQCDIIGSTPVYCLGSDGIAWLSGSVRLDKTKPQATVVMSIGAPSEGYIPMSYPFTCHPVLGQHAISTATKADGKICQVIVTNNLSEWPSSGDAWATGGFDIIVDPRAPIGDYLFGVTAEDGFKAGQEKFYVRVR